MLTHYKLVIAKAGFEGFHGTGKIPFGGVHYLGYPQLFGVIKRVFGGLPQHTVHFIIGEVGEAVLHGALKAAAGVGECVVAVCQILDDRDRIKYGGAIHD